MRAALNIPSCYPRPGSGKVLINIMEIWFLMISENSLYGVNNGTVSLHAWFVLLSQTGSFFTGGERFMPHEGGNQLMLQGWLLGPLLFHMSQGRTPAGNLNAYFSILKKLMNTASMAKHFNQPLPAVPTFKKKGRRGGRGEGRCPGLSKKFLRKINRGFGCVRGRGRWEKEEQKE